MNIALLHPQCSVKWWAIQMALQSAHALQKLWHDVTLYTFEKSDTCFPELQKWINIQVWWKWKKDSTKTPFLKGDGNTEENKRDLFNNKSSVIPSSWQLLQKGAKYSLTKLVNITTLAWHLRHVDTIVANNPPMQCVAALAKLASLTSKEQRAKIKEQRGGLFSMSSLTTIWWHHHVPWYFSPKVKNTNEQWIMYNVQWRNIFKNPQLFITHYTLYISKFFKRFVERNFVIPLIDEMIATSHYVADCIREYCGREAVIIHPILSGIQNTKYKIQNDGSLNDSNTITLFTHGRLEPGKGVEMIVRVFNKLKKSYETPFLKGRSDKITPSNEGWKISGGDGNIENNKGDLFDSCLINPPPSSPRCSDEGTSFKKEATDIHLIVFWTGSLEKKLQEEGIDVRPFEREKTWDQLRGINNKNSDKAPFLKGENYSDKKEGDLFDADLINPPPSSEEGTSFKKEVSAIWLYCSTIDAFGIAPLEAQAAGFPTVILDRGGARESILSDVTGVRVGHLVDSEEALLASISYYIEHKVFPEPVSIVNFLHTRDYFTLERLTQDLGSIITKTNP